MSRLSVYWPDETNFGSTATENPMILPFPNPRSRFLREPVADSNLKLNVVERARAIFENRQCRECGYPVVEPVEMSDSAINLSGLAIPGTSTLLGFHCCGCDAEWRL